MPTSPSLPAPAGAAEAHASSVSQAGWPYAVQQLGGPEGEGEEEGKGVGEGEGAGEGGEVQTGGEAVKRRSRSGLVLDDAWAGREGGGPRGAQQQAVPGLPGRRYASGSSAERLSATARKLRATRRWLQRSAGRERWMLEQVGSTAGLSGESSSEAAGGGAADGRGSAASSSSSSSSSGGSGGGGGTGTSPSTPSPAAVPLQCDFFSVALRGSPLAPLSPARQAALLYLLLLAVYWWACALLFLARLPEVMAVRAYLEHR